MSSPKHHRGTSSAVVVVAAADGERQNEVVVPTESVTTVRRIASDVIDRDKNAVAMQSAAAAIVEATMELKKTVKRFDSAVDEIKRSIVDGYGKNLKPSWFHGIGCCGCMFGTISLCIVTGAIMFVFVVVVSFASPYPTTN